MKTHKCRNCMENIFAIDRSKKSGQNESITAINSEITRVKQHIEIEKKSDYAEGVDVTYVSIVNYVSARCRRCGTTTTKKIVLDMKGV